MQLSLQADQLRDKQLAVLRRAEAAELAQADAEAAQAHRRSGVRLQHMLLPQARAGEAAAEEAGWQERLGAELLEATSAAADAVFRSLLFVDAMQHEGSGALPQTQRAEARAVGERAEARVHALKDELRAERAAAAQAVAAAEDRADSAEAAARDQALQEEK